MALIILRYNQQRAAQFTFTHLARLSATHKTKYLKWKCQLSCGDQDGNLILRRRVIEGLSQKSTNLRVYRGTTKSGCMSFI